MKLHLTYEFDSEDEMRAHLDGATSRTAVSDASTGAAKAMTDAKVADTEPAPVAAPEPVDMSKTEPAPTIAGTDGDGMPWDSEIHADPPSFTADGLWRARRGKADEAKAARAAFKAKGGNVAPPAEPEPAPAAAPSMPGATAMPASAPAPVSLDRVIEKINGMLQREQVSTDKLAPLYAKHSGTTAEASFGVFQTNETARANLYGALCEIEPEAPGGA